jgi:hypothetical protein
MSEETSTMMPVQSTLPKNMLKLDTTPADGYYTEKILMQLLLHYFLCHAYGYSLVMLF